VDRIAISVIIGRVYGRRQNLLYAILLHQMLYFSGWLLVMDERVVLGGVAAVYVVVALVIGVGWLRSAARSNADQPARIVGKTT